MIKRWTVFMGALLLAACSQSESEASTEAVESVDVAEAGMADAADATEADGESGSQLPASQPQIAYTYSYAFRVPADSIASVQERHADMCLKLGTNTCRIVSMDRDGAEGDYASGTLQIAVSADRARAFGQSLAEAIEGEGGEQVGASISGEDLSKQIVDTEARLRARRVLRDRLMEVLETRRGSVAELVEAERSVAQVNEEIDQAQSWLAEMRQRVALSVMTIDYRSGTPTEGGFADPIRNAIGGFGTIIGVMIGILITVFAVAIPLIIVGGIGWAGWRFYKRHWRHEDDVVVRDTPETERQTARIS
ncbi:DUF4349 domain-containing protein [Pseudoblastomonas halimionae]|uniref:DUF4349 domain-containing protein n=1 Tax=Alteriqipengyuania halimionae TaxID=1926630 RepID=A0A6I4U659_9SPHN|nr:DUF4349 domain-containing protein [Alteriqipengyuania halimionae]MXP09932.1 DUF4349 domain-containing protein [Alteriqipengyuania halimionae]